MGETNRWLGVHLKDDGSLPNGELLECAHLAEELGYSAVTMNEDVGHDSFSLLGALARETERITLGTAIVNVYTRSAMQLAMGAATVDDLSGGRALLGLSVGHHPWNDVYHGIPLESPLPRLREYVAFFGDAGDIHKAIARFYDAGCTRVLLASSPLTKVHIEAMMRALAPAKTAGAEGGIQGAG